MRFTDEERADPALEKPIRKTEKATARADKAQANIPKKKVRQTVIDPDTGKKTSKLTFEDKKKPPSKLSQGVKEAPVHLVAGKFHKEIRETEQDNVGVESAHKSEEAVETSAYLVREGYRSHKLKPYRKAAQAEQKLEKTNVNALYQKSLRENPQFTSNPLSRWQQKQSIKKQYAVAKRTGQTAGNTAQAASKTGKAARTVKEKLARQEERKGSAEGQTEKIISGLWDKYEMTRSEAKERAKPVDDAGIFMLKAELAEIKRSIAALGSVNYSSIEELEEVSERYGVLAKQLKDVETSKTELESLIADLIKDIKQRFTESFDDINNHFGMLFSEIFGGGEARLQLSDPDDVLNSDVEIYAAPPGKVIKSLSLLSGGEKSMVALTIYLAILLHRPTPFCMLDEVDAALDEANVQKYATYLKRFSHNTQLMVITHRRGTIELCDVLYGVYMQEKGVSGLLRQEFSEEFLNEVENA